MYDLPELTGWRVEAYCGTEHSEAYNSDNLPPATGSSDCATRDRIAHKLCAPCPVRRDCALDALTTDTRGVIRGGYAFPDMMVAPVRRRIAADFGVELPPMVQWLPDEPPVGRCLNGVHDMVGDNVRWREDGGQRCRACAAASDRRDRERARERDTSA